MSPQAIGVVGIVALVSMVLLRVPVAVAMVLVGTIGYAAIDGGYTALVTLGQTPFDLARAYSLSVVPLFLLMGVVVSRTSRTAELFVAANALFGARRCGLAMGTVGACAGFGAICGSSLATASTMTRVSVPEMCRHGYSDAIATGVIASGGTLGILVPPSIVLVIYALIAQESVPVLFAAALLPALLLSGLHVAAIAVLARLRPDELPSAPRLGARERVAALRGVWKMALVFGSVVGGIYLGWFSPTEAAAVGAFLTLALGFVSGQLTAHAARDAVHETVVTTGTLFFVILGAFVFAYFAVQTRIPATLGDWIDGLGVAPVLVIVLFVLVYLVLGRFLDSISMSLITVPVLPWRGAVSDRSSHRHRSADRRALARAVATCRALLRRPRPKWMRWPGPAPIAHSRTPPPIALAFGNLPGSVRRIARLDQPSETPWRASSRPRYRPSSSAASRVAPSGSNARSRRALQV